MKLKFSKILLVPGMSILALASFPAWITVAVAQSSSVEVTSPNVDCKTSDLQASAPGVGVSAPNPSRLVPNVGKLLREGVGVPAPDAEAPDVGSPGAKVSRTSVKCSNVDPTTPSGSSSNESGTTPSNTGGVQGLW
jgi:hypothetical protein